MIIFLIGFMGSGKTTMGKRLAAKLQYEFIDMDHYIEEKTGMSVPEIFAQKGEAWFRNEEVQFLEKVDVGQNLVVATGGGAPCQGKNIELMNQKGITVYIKLHPAVLAHRLINARVIRPLVAGLNREELLTYIESKLIEREPFYDQAKCIIKGENVKLDHIIALIFGKDTGPSVI
jgi:shikimate kinase